MYRDFRDIFANSEFNDNPERIAYVYFKPHLGNLDLYEVYKKHVRMYTEVSPFQGRDSTVWRIFLLFTAGELAWNERHDLLVHLQVWEGQSPQQ